MNQSISLINQNANLYVNNLNVIPVGSIICFAGSTAPSGWLLCNGNAWLIAQNSFEKGSDHFENYFNFLVQTVDACDREVSDITRSWQTSQIGIS